MKGRTPSAHSFAWMGIFRTPWNRPASNATWSVKLVSVGATTVCPARLGIITTTRQGNVRSNVHLALITREPRGDV